MSKIFTIATKGYCEAKSIFAHSRNSCEKLDILVQGEKLWHNYNFNLKLKLWKNKIE